jgi:hypothetical protein
MMMMMMMMIIIIIIIIIMFCSLIKVPTNSTCVCTIFVHPSVRPSHRISPRRRVVEKNDTIQKYPSWREKRSKIKSFFS